MERSPQKTSHPKKSRQKPILGNTTSPSKIKLIMCDILNKLKALQIDINDKQCPEDLKDISKYTGLYESAYQDYIGLAPAHKPIDKAEATFPEEIDNLIAQQNVLSGLALISDNLSNYYKNTPNNLSEEFDKLSKEILKATANINLRLNELSPVSIKPKP